MAPKKYWIVSSSCEEEANQVYEVEKDFKDTPKESILIELLDSFVTLMSNAADRVWMAGEVEDFIKPCPFCGELPAHIVDDFMHHGEDYTSCLTKGCPASNDCFVSIADWNYRVCF